MVDNVPPSVTWEALRSQPAAQMVDVRTDAEWVYVGVPDLTAANKRIVLIPWQLYPEMSVNRDFVAQMQQAGLTPDDHIYFICRSGVRSLAAAQAARDAGFRHVYNVADGFEGPIDPQGHRGRAAGWKADGLPWRQK